MSRKGGSRDLNQGEHAFVSHATSFPGSAQEPFRRELDRLLALAKTQSLTLEDLMGWLNVASSFTHGVCLDLDAARQEIAARDEELRAIRSFLSRIGVVS